MNGDSLLLNSTSRKAREHQRKRADLLVVAEQVFAQKGFHGASMEAIAEAAEYAAGTLYRYFANKEVLYAAILEAKMQELLSVLCERIAPAEPGAVALQRAIEAQFEFSTANRAFFQIYFRERMEVSRAGDEWRRIETLYRRVLDVYAEVISAGQAAGAFIPADARLYAVLLEGLVESLVRSWLTERREPCSADVAAVVQTALGAVLRAES